MHCNPGQNISRKFLTKFILIFILNHNLIKIFFKISKWYLVIITSQTAFSHSVIKAKILTEKAAPKLVFEFNSSEGKIVDGFWYDDQDFICIAFRENM